VTMPRGSARARVALFLFGCIVSVLAVAIALRGIDLEAAARIIASAAPRWLATAVAVLAVQTLVRSERWRRLLPVNAARRPRLRRIVPPVLVGYLGNTVLPARLGEPIRAAIVARREDLQMSETLGSVVLERIIDTVALSMLGLTAVVQIGSSSGFGVPVAAGVAVAVIGVAVLIAAPGLIARVRTERFARVQAFMAALAHGARVRGRARVTFGALLLSTVAWLLDAGIYWTVGQAIGIELSPQEAIIVSAIAALSTAIPAAPGYVGTFDLAVATTLGVLGFGAAAALAFAVCVHAVIIVPIVIAGGVSAVAIARPGVATPVDRPLADAARSRG
jgi:glycosyltransferase 2 family protein